MFCEILQCPSVNRGKDPHPQKIDSGRVFKEASFQAVVSLAFLSITAQKCSKLLLSSLDY